MGNGHGQGDDVNFFDTSRNDIPVQGQTPLQRDAYTDYPLQPGQPQVPGRIAQAGDPGVVTIKDGPNIIYAQAGSTIIINEGRDCRVGNGQNSYVPNYDQTAAYRQAQFAPDPRFAAQYYAGPHPIYRPVNGGGWEMPRPFVQPQIGFGFHFGGRHGGGIGFSIGAPIRPSYQYVDNSYYGQTQNYDYAQPVAPYVPYNPALAYSGYDQSQAGISLNFGQGRRYGGYQPRNQGYQGYQRPGVGVGVNLNFASNNFNNGSGYDANGNPIYSG
jgi:hypothetical protein